MDSNYLLPREKFIKYGGDSLNEVELLAIILQVGNKKYSVNVLSQILLEKYGGLENLINLPLESLMENDGIGLTKAIKIKSLYYINQKVKYNNKKKYKVQCSKDIYNYIKAYELKEEENFYILCLNNNNEILGHRHLFKGNLNSVMISPREIFKEALFINSKKICLVHNHPSGNVTPSRADIKSTDLLIQGASLIGLQIIDHIIIGSNTYFSLNDSEIIQFNN